MDLSRIAATSLPRTARAEGKPDLVALADDSKRGIGGAEARRHGVHFADTAAGADRRVQDAREAALRAERALELRDAREAAWRDQSFDIDV